jgi:putative ATP-dependent endonuclease of the OLD family
VAELSPLPEFLLVCDSVQGTIRSSVKICTVRVHNFRSISDLTLECRGMVVLLGPNNHGKSNLLNAIEFSLSTSTKPTREDFCAFRVKDDDELWVELVFENLAEQEKTTFKKYLDAEGKLTIRKTAELNGEDIETGYRGYVNEPEQWWLKSSEISRLLKTADVQEHAKTIRALDALLKGGRITKQQVEDFQSQYIAEHRNGLTFTRALEDGPLLGVKNVAGGVLPDIYLVPAVRDLSDEIKVKATTSFGRIIQRAVQEMASQNPAYSELRSRLDELVNTLNAREGNRDRPSELKQIEQFIATELEDWNVRVQIEVNTPEVEKILELGTELQLDDGVCSSAERKGHGLQRAVLFALLRTWAKVVRNSKSIGTVPRKASQSLVFVIEEPELFLHPQAQRRLAEALKELSEQEDHQIFICTHSTHFVDLREYESIVIVSKPTPTSGTTVRYCKQDLFEGEDAKSRKDRFHLAYWINPDRGELFFARRVVLVEGETERVVIPYLAKKLDKFDAEVSLIDCGSKFNLPVYIALLNAFDIPYVVVHDEDPLPDPVPADWDGDKRREKQKVFNVNAQVAGLVKTGLGSVQVLSPDFERASGVSKTQGERKGKAIAALDHFETIKKDDIPAVLINVIAVAYGAAATAEVAEAQPAVATE